MTDTIFVESFMNLNYSPSKIERFHILCYRFLIIYFTTNEQWVATLKFRKTLLYYHGSAYSCCNAYYDTL